jgi:hypothetical protein
MVLAGSFHSSASGDAEDKAPSHPPAVCLVEHWDGFRWVTTRQVWDETERRYKVAA